MKRDTIKNITGYFTAYWKQCILLFILIFIINVASLATPYILKIIIDDIFPKKDFEKLVQILLLLVAIYIGRVGMAFLFDVLYTKVSQQVISDIRSNIMQKVFNKPLAFFQDKQIGETIFILSNDVNNVQYSLSYLINDTLNNVILIGSIIAIMLSINIELTLISLSTVPVIVLFIIKLSPLIHSKFKKVQESETKLFNCFTDELKNIKLIKTFHTNKAEEKKISDLQQQIIDLQVNNAKTNSFNKNSITFIVATIPVIVLIYGGLDVMNNTITLGSLIAYIQYINRLLPPVTSITNGFSSVIKSFVSMERINTFLKDEQPQEPEALQEGVIIHKIENVAFKQVTFSYHQRSILDKVNLNFQAGKTYLITGESGSGKSTILNMLCGLIAPDSGKVIVNQTTLYQHFKNKNEQICLVEKDNQIFSDTIFNNVNYGTFDKNEDDIKKALEKVNMLTKVVSLEKGIHTELNSNMNTFSEGQRQRISLARVFLKQYGIIIIDEATASLDVSNERKILQNIRLHSPDAIILISSHRFSFDDLCDEIYEFRNGQVLVKQPKNELLLCE